MVAAPRVFYRPQLDALRAIAVSAVLVHHFLPVEQYIPEDFLTLGLLAVRLFFVLSGYLITGILLRARRQSFGAALRQFYLRRTLRIFPIYYLTLFVLVVVGVPLVRPYLPWHLLYLSNILFVVHPQAARPCGHVWSLSVEEQFYFVWPFLLLLTPYRYILRVIVGAIVLGVCWKTLVVLHPLALGGYIAGSILTPACLDSLGLGTLLAFVEHDETLSRYRNRFLRGALGAGVSVVLLQATLYLTDRWLQLFWSTAYLGVSLVFVWLVGRAAEGFKGRLGALMEWRPLLYLGKISYGMYLYHYFMLGWVHDIAAALHLKQPGMWLTFLCATTLTCLVASASWHLIERPINRLKERIGTNKRDAEPAGETAGEFTT